MRRSSFAIAAVLLFISGGSSSAQTSAGTKLDQFIAPLIELQVFSGTVVVAQGDRIVLERSYGLADVENGIPNRQSTVYRIASISKSFTKALVGRLADQGLLSLDDPLSRWLPQIPSATSITVRMLLDHRAGIPSINSLRYDEEAFEPNTLSKLVDSIAKQRLDFEPGSRQRYSNGGYAVLARVIELAAGAPYETVLEREIIRPLNLTQTLHESDGMIVKNLARGYMPSPARANRMIHAPFQEMETKAGGGSLVSSTGDLIAWVRTIGRGDILKDRTWAELFPSKDSVLEFQGRSPGFNVIVVHDRKRDRTTVVLANNYGASMVSDIAVAADAIADGKAPKELSVARPASASSSDLRALAGKYQIPDGRMPLPPGVGIELRLVDGQIVAYLGSVPVDVLIPQGNRRYLARGIWSMIEAPAGETVDSIVVRTLYRENTFTATRAR